jgi:ribosomal protein S27AE
MKEDEREIQRKIRALRGANPRMTVAQVGQVFGKSYSWAYSRIKPAYMPRRIRKELANMCPRASKIVIVSSGKERLFCDRCRDYVPSDHFRNEGKT